MSNRKNLKTLEKLFPNVFGANVTPLSKGVHECLIQKTDFTLAEIKRALSYWTNTYLYLNSIINSKYRFYLDGSQAEEVLEQEKIFAKDKLNKINARTKNNEAGWEFREKTLRKDFPNTFGKIRVPLTKDTPDKLINHYPDTCEKIIREFIIAWRKTKAYHISVLENQYLHDLSGVTKQAVPEVMKENSLKWLNILKSKKDPKAEQNAK